jgi:Transposase IS66 family.
VLGLELSIGTIQNCIVESARALAPVEKQLLDDLCNESLIHADETSHNEAGARLWLWVFVSSQTALFLIGHRTDEIFVNVFDALIGFSGHLMTDGYGVYRTFHLRLRCWAHLLRKARGLSECYTSASQRLGQQVETIMNGLIAAVYQAREGPDGGAASILPHHQEALENLRKACVAMSDSPHKKTVNWVGSS